MVRSYPGRKWSRGNRSWYVPDEEDSYRQIVRHFRGKLKFLAASNEVISIRQGKGSNDRVVPVSDMVWHKFDEYVAAYQPHEFLFEGQHGGRYTAGSVHVDRTSGTSGSCLDTGAVAPPGSAPM